MSDDTLILPIKQEDDVEKYLKLDPMEILIGAGLLPLAVPQGGDLLDRVNRLRKEVAAEIGIILPSVQIRDSQQLEPTQYQIKLEDQVVASDFVYPDMYLAMDAGIETSGKVQGIKTLDPTFGFPALWIDAAAKEQAESYGYTVVEPGAAMATHLREVIQKLQFAGVGVVSLSD